MPIARPVLRDGGSLVFFSMYGTVSLNPGLSSGSLMMGFGIDLEHDDARYGAYPPSPCGGDSLCERE